jgi:hypothetical protein
MQDPQEATSWSLRVNIVYKIRPDHVGSGKNICVLDSVGDVISYQFSDWGNINHQSEI